MTSFVSAIEQIPVTLRLLGVLILPVIVGWAVRRLWPVLLPGTLFGRRPQVAGPSAARGALLGTFLGASLLATLPLWAEGVGDLLVGVRRSPVVATAGFLLLVPIVTPWAVHAIWAALFRVDWVRRLDQDLLAGRLLHARGAVLRGAFSGSFFGGLAILLLAHLP